KRARQMSWENFNNNYLKIYKTKFPKKDYVIIEANPLIRYCVRKLGLKEGIFRAGFFILPIVIAITYFISVNFRFFLAGCYYMMIIFHLTNLLALKRMKEK
ncbi:hypothetical protein LCGC14_2534750, partial [marine sediment metagenome]